MLTGSSFLEIKSVIAVRHGNQLLKLEGCFTLFMEWSTHLIKISEVRNALISR